MTIGKIGVLAGSMAVLMLLFLSLQTVAVEVEQATTASVTVNEYISVTLSNAPILFGSLNPGVVDQTANVGNGYPMTVQVDSVTNVVTNLSLRGTDFTGAGTFGVGNLSFSNSSSAATATDMATTYAGPAIYSNFDAIPAPLGGPAQTRDVYFWIDVPSGQTAGAYASDVYINVAKDA